MLDFLMQPYAPIVNVAIKNNQYVFTQRSTSSIDKLGKWNVPIFVWDPSTNASNVVWVLSDGKTCTNGFKLSVSTTYVFHYLGSSYARIRPSDELVQRIINLDTSKIDAVTQAAIVLDRIDHEDEIG